MNHNAEKLDMEIPNTSCHVKMKGLNLLCIPQILIPQRMVANIG